MTSFQCLNVCNQYGRFRSKILNKRRYIIKCESNEKKLRILIAGGGIGGLALALAAKNRGYEVKVFEKNLSAARGEGKNRGPIQLSSSALSVLQAIDGNVGKQIIEAGFVTGDRIHGIADGTSGEWVAKFDLMTPALDRGLPVTRVICRMELQEILVKAVGFDILSHKSKVVDFIEDSNKVTVILEDGRKFDGDILVGADGIWSEVRTKLFGKQEAVYSGYTSYNGITNYVPPYVDTVGFRVFIGCNQYFVATEIGNEKMQWYAFYREPPMSSTVDARGGGKERLLELFGHWCDEVVTLISKTEENMILQRNIYDRDMIDTWGIGRVTLLGDAVHPMQPNLGQGGCMAIEDCHQLILELNEVVDTQLSDEIVSALRSYEKKRWFRVNAVHSASRAASKMITLYQPSIQLGSDHLSFLQFCMQPFMSWVIAQPLFMVKDGEILIKLITLLFGF